MYCHVNLGNAAPWAREAFIRASILAESRPSARRRGYDRNMSEPPQSNQQYPNEYPPQQSPQQPYPYPSQYAQGQYPTGQPYYQQQPPAVPPKKAWYKKWWIWLIVLILIAAPLSQCGDGSASLTEAPTPTTTEEQAEDPDKAAEDAIAESQAQRAEEERLAEEEAEAAAQAEAEAEAERLAQEEAEAAAQAELLDPANYAEISDRDWVLLARDPDAHVGEKYIIYGHITQADQATGTELFRANTSGEQFADWWDYETNTIVGADASIVAQVVTDDLAKMYVQIAGGMEYETSIGGTATATVVVANILEHLGTTD